MEALPRTILMRSFVDATGTLLIGKHKGANYKDAPPSWIKWAKENIHGIKEQIETVEAIKTRRATGKVYILKRYGRRKQ